MGVEGYVKVGIGGYLFQIESDKLVKNTCRVKREEQSTNSPRGLASTTPIAITFT